MKISVIIPTFNRIEWLPRAIDSVLSQDETPLIDLVEIVVIDDGSSDGSASLVSNAYPNVKLIRQANLGVSAARNTGIQVSLGDWLAFLDSDDEWLPHKLRLQAERLQFSNNRVCHTEEIWIRNGRRVNQMNKHKKQGGEIFQQCLPLCAMSPSSIMIHRDVFTRVGVFDEALPACEDYDLWLRMSSQYEVDFVEEPCIRKYGGHDDQLSRAHWGMDRFRVLALVKILSSEDPRIALTDVQRQEAHSMLRQKNTILLNGARKHNNDQLIKECIERKNQFKL